MGLESDELRVSELLDLLEVSELELRVTVEPELLPPEPELELRVIVEPEELRVLVLPELELRVLRLPLLKLPEL